MAEKINAKLGYRPVQPVEEEKEVEAPPAETFKRYEEELEINDFPQTARWKVTSKARWYLICNNSSNNDDDDDDDGESWLEWLTTLWTCPWKT